MKEAEDIWELVTFDSRGLVPAVAQDVDTGEVLMLAYMNRESLRQTLETRKVTYWSRSRQELWVKGATSGHFQHLEELRVDCDGDAILVRVRQIGPACHTGARTCFFRAADASGRLSPIRTSDQER
ncbi:MAG: phosphoribosyl-AMP cyclohydrolase [Armatimonadetes bacterium]|nr:phosphoribosyl-AMP cyclohydrolase [Armatimonadota bacterium]